MTDKTYEQATLENWPKDLLPAHEGMYCPPFRATLFRLAKSLADNQQLTPELQHVHQHCNECGCCHSTITAVISRLKATTKPDTGPPVYWFN